MKTFFELPGGGEVQLNGAYSSLSLTTNRHRIVTSQVETKGIEPITGEIMGERERENMEQKEDEEQDQGKTRLQQQQRWSI